MGQVKFAQLGPELAKVTVALGKCGVCVLSFIVRFIHQVATRLLPCFSAAAQSKLRRVIGSGNQVSDELMKIPQVLETIVMEKMHWNADQSEDKVDSLKCF